MDLFNISAEGVVDFYFFGVMLNLFAFAFMILATVIKTSSLTKEEADEVIKYLKTRRYYIKHYNSRAKRLMHNLQFLLPVYVAWIVAVYVWHISKTVGAQGMIQGTIASDEFSIVQLVKYDFVWIDEE